MIADTFKTEKDLRIKHPKTKYFKLKDVFIAYWDNFVKFAEYKNLYIRPVVFMDVERMMICNSHKLGSSVFKCSTCGNYKFVFHTCKSRFCNSCGVKYSKQRSLSIESKLISGTHRLLVFTISDILWPFFLEKRSRFNPLFEAVSSTINSWYKSQYKSLNLKLGFVLTLHTFGRDGKWNVHIHCLLSEFALGDIFHKK